MPGSLKLLITGASGYIGGSVLTTLLSSKHQDIKDLRISALFRGDATQESNIKELGVTPIRIKDLDDVEAIEKAASQHDVVIHTASGYHMPSAKALVRGLTERKKETGNEVYYIHQSGTSKLGDTPFTNTNPSYNPSFEFTDNSSIESIYSYEKFLESITPYAQRSAELVAIDAGVDNNVKTYIIMSPTIYGIGSGPMKKDSIQIPILIKGALAKKQAAVVGKGEGVWDYVHISDLVLLFEALLQEILIKHSNPDAPGELPYGKKGIYFSSAGRFSWREVAEIIGKTGHELGVLNTKEVKEISLDEASKIWTGGDKQLAELGFCSTSRTKADLARGLLGWKPLKNEQDWVNSFRAEFDLVLKSQAA